MIFKCNCGALKNGQPYRASGELPWRCPKCEPGKSREGGRAAQERDGGKSYPSQTVRRASIGR